jgi:hypothetical protein
MTTEEPTELDALAAAVQTFANAREGAPVIVGCALVVWEQAQYDDDGRVLRALRYALPMDATTMAGGLGLAVSADALIRADLFGPSDDDG